MPGLQNTFWDEACAAELTDGKLLAAMARFEAALALAGAEAGLVPGAAARTIARVAARASFDAAALAGAGRRAGSLAIPFVKSLTDQVAAVSPHSARYVHLGATSQDAVDTGVALCLVPACARLQALARRLGDAAARLAKKHARTPMAGRTLLQSAVPVPFGWKAAVWLSMLARGLRGFRAAARAACVLQLGGAAGTLSGFGTQGDTVAAALAAELGLAPAPVTWHSARDGFARLGSEAAILAGAAGKIARDVALMMQPEVGELGERAAPGRGGSSSMPHKRNPVGSLAALEASLRAPALAATLLAELTPEHERGLGQWQSQWLTLRDLLAGSAGALAAMAQVLEGLKVNRAQMRANLERAGGLAYSESVALAIARSLGKPRAHALVETLAARAAREGKSLKQIVRGHAPTARAIGTGKLEALFDPLRCFGAAASMIGRALAEWSAATSRETAP